MSAKSAYLGYNKLKKGNVIRVPGSRLGRTRKMNELSLRITPDYPPFYKMIGSHRGTTKTHAEGMKCVRDRHEIPDRLLPTFVVQGQDSVMKGVVSK